MRIIAIDPGYERCGVAIIEKTERGTKEKLIFSTCIRTSAKDTDAQRLHDIGNGVEGIIQTYTPQRMAIEALFFSNNQKTALKVAEARGVILYIAEHARLPVHEYHPLAIKIAVTGYGKSNKNNMMDMLPHLIDISEANTKNTGRNVKILLDDEFDAIAVGLTFFAHERL